MTVNGILLTVTPYGYSIYFDIENEQWEQCVDCEMNDIIVDELSNKLEADYDVPVEIDWIV